MSATKLVIVKTDRYWDYCIKNSSGINMLKEKSNEADDFKSSEKILFNKIGTDGHKKF